MKCCMVGNRRFSLLAIDVSACAAHEFGGPRDPFITLACLQNAIPIIDTPPRHKALDRPPRSLPQREIAGVRSLEFAKPLASVSFFSAHRPPLQSDLHPRLSMALTV